MNNDTVWIDLTGEIYSNTARTFIDLAGKPETRDAASRLAEFADSIRIMHGGYLMPLQRQDDGGYIGFGLVTDEEMDDMRAVAKYVAKRLRAKTFRDCENIAFSERFLEFVRENEGRLLHQRSA